jgi:hypothetical protein
VRAQFCADIDAWLKAHNIDYKIDCSKVGDDYDFSKAKAPKDHTNYRCREIIHDGWVKVRASLGTCDTDSYINWESASRFELKEAGACRGSPLVLDLDGNGVNLTSLEDGVSFDLLGTGERVRTAWIDRGDALLTYDWNGNGVIDGAGDLFGNASNGGEYDDGFAALAELDSNGDGRVDAKDAAFAGLRVWRDTNHDGVSAPGELSALRDVGVRSLTVAAHKGVDSFDKHGNDLSLASDFVREDGTRGAVVDAYLRFKP